LTGIDLTRRRELGELVEDTWRLYTSNLGLFLPIVIVIVVPLDLLVLGVGWGELWHHYDSSPPAGEGLTAVGLRFGVFQPLVTAAHIAAVMALGRGERPTPWWSVTRGLERWGAVLAVIVLSAIVIGLGFVALLIPGIYLVVALYFAAQAVVAEDRSPVDALRRSRELVRDQWWRVFGIGIVFSVMIGVVGGIATFGLRFAADAADSQALELLGSMVADVFTIGFTALAATLVFFDLRVRQEGVPPPPRWAPAGWEAPGQRA
jgi:multisubunit Na+/H+ antiporter MnhC subunit